MTMKKKTVNSKILTILICLLTLLPSVAKAQVGFDAVSIEAYIKAVSYTHLTLPTKLEV